MNLIPIAHTQVDWSNFNRACQDLLLINPIKNLDANSLMIDKHSSYLASLGLDNEPMTNLRMGFIHNNSFDHVYITLLGKFPYTFVIELVNKTVFRLLSKNVVTCDSFTRPEVLCFITGSVMEWRTFVISYSNKDSNFRKFANKVYTIFETMGYKEIFYSLEKKNLPDGTFTLC